MFPTLFKDVPLVLCKLNFFCFLLFFTIYLLSIFTFNSRLIILVIVLKLHIKFFSNLQVFLKAGNLFLLILPPLSLTWNIAKRPIVNLMSLVILFFCGPRHLNFLAFWNKWATKPDLNCTLAFTTTRPLFMEREHVVILIILSYLWFVYNGLIASLCRNQRFRRLELRHFYFYLFFLIYDIWMRRSRCYLLIDQGDFQLIFRLWVHWILSRLFLYIFLIFQNYLNRISSSFFFWKFLFQALGGLIIFILSLVQ